MKRSFVRRTTITSVTYSSSLEDIHVHVQGCAIVHAHTAHMHHDYVTRADY